MVILNLVVSLLRTVFKPPLSLNFFTMFFLALKTYVDPLVASNPLANSKFPSLVYDEIHPFGWQVIM